MHAARGRIVQGLDAKVIEIDTARPATIERFPWAGHIGLKMLPEVIRAIDGARSTLVFTNVRSATEIWYQAILNARPDWAGRIALHHGSLEREVRDWVEEGLRLSKLKAVVCTSSLDLGVDFTPVDQVLQIGSPKGVARLLQRAGRSGHQPGAISRVTIVPAQALELVEAAAAREAAAERRLEPRIPLRVPLDALVQHLVTCALGGGFVPAGLLRGDPRHPCLRATDRRAVAMGARFRRARRREPQCVSRIPARRAIGADGVAHVPDAAIARRHRASIGTIVSEASISVQFRNGHRLGHVEESFIARLAAGDCFVFAGRVLEFVRVREMTAWVKPAAAHQGDRAALGGRQDGAVHAAGRAHARTDRAGTPRHLRVTGIAAGAATARIAEALVRAALTSASGWSSASRRATGTTSSSIRSKAGSRTWAWPRCSPIACRATRRARSASWSTTTASGSCRPRPSISRSRDLGRLLAAPDVEADILAGLNAAEMGRRQFRELARVAGLVFQGYPGQTPSNRQLQASSGLLYDVFAQYDPDNLLLAQAVREVLERQLEAPRLAAALARLRGSRALLLAAGASHAVRVSADGRNVPREAHDGGARGARRAHGRSTGTRGDRRVSAIARDKSGAIP